jgi:hypothetical protein
MALLLALILFLVSAISLRASDKFLCNRFAKCDAGYVVHWIVDPGPDTRTSRLPAQSPDKIRMTGKQICQNFAPCS